MGSPTVANSVLHSVAGFMHLVKGLKFKNKKAAAFGCSGWSGEGPKVISESMKSAGFELIDDQGFRNLWNPDESKEEAVKYGRKLQDHRRAAKYNTWDKNNTCSVINVETAMNKGSVKGVVRTKVAKLQDLLIYAAKHI